MTGLIGAGDELPKLATPTAAASQDEVPVTGPLSLECLFTLPFALHLRPLPHISFLAEHDSNASSEQDDGSDGSAASSAGSNYRAGIHRLQPQTNNVPPHSLRTISMLLERTGCLDAVTVWSQMLEVLEAADEDPHFSNLRSFFDARFDSSGRLVDGKKDSGSAPLRHGVARGKRRPSNSQYGTSPTRDTDAPPRRTSVASGTGSGTAATNMFLMRRRKSSRRNDDEENARCGLDGAGSGASQRLRAPEIIVIGREGSEPRHVRFKVRLDLHSVGLAPEPPRPPIVSRASARSTMSKQLAASPPKARGGLEGVEVQRVVSNTSSDHSHSESLSLRPVTSPDSFRSKAISDESDDHFRRRGSDALSTSPTPATRVKQKRNVARTMTNSSTAGGASLSSELGTSPDPSEPARPRALFGNVAKAEDGSRRPSMIQRLMDFKGLRSTSSRKDSGTDLSNPSTEELSNDANLPQPIVNNGLTRTLSPTSAAVADTHGSSLFSSAERMRRLRSQTEHSDMSNEEALDMADDDGSVASSYQNSATFSKRRTSSSAGPMALSGYRPAPGMSAVQEGSVLSPFSAAGNGRAASSDDPSSSEGLDAVQSAQKAGVDFLALLRKAANTSLTLHDAVRPPMPSPARTPKGSTSAGSGQYPNAQTPPGSIDLEEREHTEALLAPFKAGNSGFWWLSGSVDPLPVSIACALSQALGWNGVMELCYGKHSRSEREGSFQPLGRAAEMDRKQQDETMRVSSWARSISGNGDVDTRPPPRGEEASDADTSTKLGSLVLGDAAPGALFEDVAPSESASLAGRETNLGGVNNVKKISDWLRKKSGQLMTTPAGDDDGPASSGNGKGAAHDSSPFRMPFAQSTTRTWQDWAELTRSIADWLQEYEVTRVRSGMAGEVGHEIDSDILAKPQAAKSDSALVGMNFDSSRTRYSSRASYQVPYCVVTDAMSKHNSFRRRHGIPEGLPVGPYGEEMGDYRWARKRLSASHLATSSTLAAQSLAHCLQQIATSDWTFASAWELDYLEMCVFRSPVVSRRFPSPGRSVVPTGQTYAPDPQDAAACRRAMPCPYPSAEGTWSSVAWLQWLRQIKDGMIVVPAVSWQAWWTLIAVLNGGDGTDRALDVQLKAEEESFAALDDLEAVYL